VRGTYLDAMRVMVSETSRDFLRPLQLFRFGVPSLRSKFIVYFLLVHGQVTIIFVVSVCLFVCLFVCAEFFSAVFDPISIKLRHMLYVWVWLCLLEYRGCATHGGWVTP